MTTQYLFNKFINGFNGFGLLFCDAVYTVTLSAATEASIAVPLTSAMGGVNASVNNKWIAVFSYEAAKNVYVALNATAAVPAGATLALSTSELNPSAKTVKSGDVIHVICADASTDMSIAFYAIQE